MQYPELIGRVRPMYPPNARSNREQGRAVFYGVIEADGTLSHLTLIQRAISNEAGRCQEFFCIFLKLLNFSFLL